MKAKNFSLAIIFKVIQLVCQVTWLVIKVMRLVLKVIRLDTLKLDF